MEFLRPETNVPVEIALRYSDGKPVEGQYGPQLYFTLADGRGLYVPPVVGDKLVSAGIRAGQPFELCKREVKAGGKKQIQWEVAPVLGTVEEAPRAEQRTPPPVTAMPASNAVVQQQQTQVSNPNAVIGLRAVGNLESAGFEAVAVIARVEAEAKAKLGDNFEFTSEDVRAIWLSLFIGVDRAVGVSQWRH